MATPLRGGRILRAGQDRARADRRQADALFLPKLINVPYPGAHWGPAPADDPGHAGDGGSCFARGGDQTSVLRPLLFRDVAKGYQSREFAAELAGLGAALAKLSAAPDAERLPTCLQAAVQAQRAFEDGWPPSANGH